MNSLNLSSGTDCPIRSTKFSREFFMSSIDSSCLENSPRNIFCFVLKRLNSCIRDSEEISSEHGVSALNFWSNSEMNCSLYPGGVVSEFTQVAGEGANCLLTDFNNLCSCILLSSNKGGPLFVIFGGLFVVPSLFIPLAGMKMNLSSFPISPFHLNLTFSFKYHRLSKASIEEISSTLCPLYIIEWALALDSLISIHQSSHIFLGFTNFLLSSIISLNCSYSCFSVEISLGCLKSSKRLFSFSILSSGMINFFTTIRMILCA
ncbi:unnamed protein product [Moneuplotes crassus]|uniref:Uncharacterized protein n=1 Tax=Euplotes crassus TaxID=5936 RepID=A0AAD1U4Y1_EUPCR|nr:unnamed protein product [Moneuplotes crassus]